MATDKSNGEDQLHVIFFPFMAQGHVRPAIDMAKLFASRGQRSTIVTTSHFAQPLSESLRNDTASFAAQIDVITVSIPCSEVGLRDGTESVHMTKDHEEQQKFFKAVGLIGPQLDELLKRHRPDCLVADMFFPWTASIAARHGVTRIVFHGSSYFAICASLSVAIHKPHKSVSSGSEPFVIPFLPDEIVFTLDKIPDFMKNDTNEGFARVYEESRKAELTSYGVLVNSFYELEPAYAECYTKVLGVNKAWHIGPLLLYNELKDKNENGGDFVDEHGCLKWLDSKQPGSVIYICFGSLGDFSDAQLLEIAAGIEASGKEFIWVVRKEKGTEEWLPEGFEARTEGRGLIIRGWAPQVAILQHESVGGFVTHCGWNSTLEGVCAGMPMVTWPLFAEQFYNEKLVSQVLKIGVEVGVGKWSRTGGDFVSRDAVGSAVRRVMEGDEAAEMRSRAEKLAEMARLAVEEGGSSWLGLNALFQDLRSQRSARS